MLNAIINTMICKCVVAIYGSLILFLIQNEKTDKLTYM